MNLSYTMWLSMTHYNASQLVCALSYLQSRNTIKQHTCKIRKPAMHSHINATFVDFFEPVHVSIWGLQFICSCELNSTINGVVGILIQDAAQELKTQFLQFITS